MNVRDSERMAGFLLDEGLEPAPDENSADVVIFNTCTVRRRPEQKVMSLLGRMREIKNSRPGMVLAVAGCVAQQEGSKLLERAPHLDMVIGTHAFARLPELLKEVDSGKRVTAVDWLDRDDPCLFVNPVCESRPGHSAFVTIMQGCDNFCSFCVVPYVRGRERSRPAKDIIAEVEGLAEAGFREVTLLGQNVNSYGVNGGGPGFPGLLSDVASVAGIDRVRFTTSHPKDLSEELISVIADNDKVMEHMHLPVQAGSTKVLESMNRKYTREGYLDLVEKLRSRVPGVSITTDLIAGFPGETEEDFLQTLRLLDEVRYDEAFSFVYCDRPFAKASEFPGQVPENVKKERLYRLQEKQNAITLEQNRAEAGRVHEVLVEGPSMKNPKKLTGRTRTNKLLHFDMPDDKDIEGKIVKVKVTRGLKHSLAGKLI